MPRKNFNFTKSDEEVIDNKLKEINKKLVMCDKKPIRAFELVRFLIQEILPLIEITINGEIKLKQPKRKIFLDEAS